jgi:putative membrane protein
MARTVEQSSHETPLLVRLGISWLTNALILGIVTALLTDVRVKNFGTLLLAAVVFGVLNTLLKPLLRLITLPLAFITLGIAWFFVSLLMLVITNDIVSGFSIHGFWTYVEATVIIWIVNVILDYTPGPWQITGKRRQRHEPRG